MKKILILLILLVLISPAFSNDSFTFLAFGDNRSGYDTYETMLQKISTRESFVFAINTGDFVSPGTEKEYNRYLSLIKKYPDVHIYHVLGNHDITRGGGRRFAKYFGAYYYSFDYKNSHFVILNNVSRISFNEKQLNWLKSDLAKTRKKHIFVCMHKPIFDPTGIFKSHVMDSSSMSKRLQKVFEEYKVDYVIAGHIHGYAYAERNGVKYVVTGGAGAPLYLPRPFGGFYHYVRFNVSEDDVEFEVVRIFE